MKFTEIVCPNCGGDGKMQERGGEYVCGYCGKHFHAEYVDEQEALMKALGEAKRVALANARRNMYEAAHAENISSTQLVSAAREVKKYSPGDFMANFYETACNDDVRLVNKFLDRVDVKKEEKAFLFDICEFMIISLSKRNIDAMKVFVTRAQDEHVFTSGEYLHYIDRIEEEAKKLDEGLYNADIRRDAFIAYSSKDMAEVDELASYLKKEGLKCFVALHNLRHGKGAAENYQQLLEKVMMKCASVVFVSTQNSRDLGCDALDKELPFIFEKRADIYRIEYRPESDNGDTTEGAKILLEEYFEGLEYARSPEEVLKRLVRHKYGLDKSAPQPEPKPQPAPMPQSQPKPELQPEPKPQLQPQPKPKAQPQPEPQPEPKYEPQPTPEELYVKGKKYYDAIDYKNAVIYFQKAAEQGHAEAQHDLGKCYYCGYGVQEDKAKAVEWYTKSAEQGNADAQYWLGDRYYYGEGMTQNYAKAVEWYTKAAGQGHAIAQYNLGNCYYVGRGVTQNYAKAVEWYTKAAERGYMYVQYALGRCYENGRGVTQNYAKAAEWYKKAVDQGFAAAEDLERVERLIKPTPEEFFAKGMKFYNTKDSENAVRYFRQAAEQGLAKAQYWLGECYYYGRGVSQDYVKAKEWYKKAAEQGHAAAKKNLERIERLIKPTPEELCAKGKEYYDDFDYNAVKYIQKAAEQGHAEAQNNLGDCYYHGLGVTQNYAKAVEWYTKAAEQGHMYAQYWLGRCYENGRGVPQDYVKAAEWYQKAAEQGLAGAQYDLGRCYENGRGVPQDYVKAVEWYRKAVDQGFAAAKEALERVKKFIK